LAIASCACDGTLTSGCDLPPGYLHKPFAHDGQCDGGAGLDATPPAQDATNPQGAPCAVDADCGDPTFACAYAMADGCSARGVCEPIHGSVTCDAASTCACDGTLTQGCDLPSGYLHKPWAGRAQCDAGALDAMGD
jgi:hypothetical protein